MSNYYDQREIVKIDTQPSKEKLKLTADFSTETMEIRNLGKTAFKE